jgi:hypothetical protein
MSPSPSAPALSSTASISAWTRWNAVAAKPGTDLIAAYRISGDATVSADIATPDGRVVRELARALNVSKGDHSLRWDGLDPDGRLIKDGKYVLRLFLVDAVGQQPVHTATVTIDGTRPRIKRVSPRLLPRRRGFAVAVTDRASGVRRASLRINGLS